jgi:hypothetical protein
MHILRTLSAVGFVTLGLLACEGGSSESSAGNDPSEQDLTAVKQQLSGSWGRVQEELGGFGARSIYFSPDGTFFRDRQSIVLGVLGPGSNPVREERDTGTYVVDMKSHTLQLTFAPDPTMPPGTNTMTLDFALTPAHIVLGVIAPGSNAPGRAKLMLQQHIRPGTLPATPPPEHYEHADSTCKSDADCVKERADKTWDPGRAGEPACKENACSLK